MKSRVDRQQAEEFERKLIRAAQAICPQFDVDVRRCVLDAINATCMGKFAVHHNYFNMNGEGDLGHNVIIRTRKTNDVENGGMTPTFITIAKFSSPTAAVREYCIRERKGAQNVG